MLRRAERAITQKGHVMPTMKGLGPYVACGVCSCSHLSLMRSICGTGVQLRRTHPKITAFPVSNSQNSIWPNQKYWRAHHHFSCLVVIVTQDTLTCQPVFLCIHSQIWLYSIPPWHTWLSPRLVLSCGRMVTHQNSANVSLLLTCLYFSKQISSS